MKKVANLSAFMVMIIFMVMFMVIFIVVFSCFAEEQCPDKTFTCPLGEKISIDLCWSWDSLSCQICLPIADEVDSRCEHPHCTEEWIDHSDGCSAPGISEEMTRIFGAACYIHDLCYSSPGRPKSDCDSEFFSNLLEICNFPGVPATIGGNACEAVARVAYHSVVEFGQDAYDKDQAWAENHCYENPLSGYENPLLDCCDGKDTCDGNDVCDGKGNDCNGE